MVFYGKSENKGYLPGEIVSVVYDDIERKHRDFQVIVSAVVGVEG